MQTFIAICFRISFFTIPFFNQWLSIVLCCPHHLCHPRQMYPSISPLPLIATILISVVTKDVFMAASVLTTVTATNTCMIFVAFRGLLTPTGSKASDNKIERILALHSGLLTTPLRIMSSVNSTSLLAIQPLNALSFVAMYSSRLPILLLIMSLLLILWIGP